MSVPTNNPMSNSHPPHSAPTPTSQQSYHIAGISTTVYGLSELPQGVTDVACLWLLHPRLQTQECMAPVAASMIRAWNEQSKGKGKGLIAVAFDQRNHGRRQVDKLANEAWRQGNERHAQDMFSIYNGTARDTSLLIDYISSYVFPTGTHSISSHLALGISLGGHAVWHLLLQDPRVTAGIVVIGCPDYIALMSDRARLSKRKTYTSSSPPGKDFIGSEDFPKGLVEAVERYDPAGLMLGELGSAREPSENEKTRLRPIMRDALGGKRILCLSGGADKLVPYAAGKPFLDWLKSALRKDGGWFNDRGTVLTDFIDPGAGHEYSEKMKEEAIKFVCETLASGSGRSSKI